MGKNVYGPADASGPTQAVDGFRKAGARSGTLTRIDLKTIFLIELLKYGKIYFISYYCMFLDVGSLLRNCVEKCWSHR